MAKKFSELKCSDSVFVWWYDKLYEYPVDENASSSLGILCLKLKHGPTFHVHEEAIKGDSFIYGIDGWHEYKILGTSKEAVKNLLKTTLENDLEKLKKEMSDWLENF